MPIIAFLTDFGVHDWFVASMKGVALGINPDAAVLDITHDIDQGDIRSAAFVLDACRKSFPESTVFVVVVDPGVGSARRAVVVKAGGRLYVGPDNGVLSFVMDDAGDCEVREITNAALFHPPVSATFHGRDLFAPVGAHLSRGASPDTVGPPCENPVRLERPAVTVAAESVSGEVVYIDRFGNALTSIDQAALGRMSASPAIVETAGVSLPLCDYYSQRPHGEPLALIDSVGCLEIAVNGGSAAERLGLRPGARVVVKGGAAAGA